MAANKGLYTGDLVLTIAKATVTGDVWATSATAIPICGISNVDAIEGTRDQKEVKPYCGGTQVFHAKKPNMGTATLTIPVFAPDEDLGQKMLYDAAVDEKFILFVQYTATKTERLRLQKTKSEKRNMDNSGVIIDASVELGLHGYWEVVTDESE